MSHHPSSSRRPSRRAPPSPLRLALIVAALLLAAFAPSSRVLAADVSATDSLDVARSLIGKERYREAAEVARRLLDRLEASQPTDTTRWADVAEVLVDARLKQRRPGEDLPPIAARGLAIRERALGPDSLATLRSLRLLGLALSGVANFDSAKVILERVVRIAESRSGSESRDLALAVDDLAGVLSDAGDYAGAVEAYRRSLRVWERVKGADNIDLSYTMRSLGIALQELGKFSAADSFYQRSLAIREKQLGPDDPSVAMALLSIGLLRADMGDYAASLPLYERALSIWEKAEGPEGPSLLYALNNLATALRRMGDFTRAQGQLERALAIGLKAFGERHPFVAGVLFNLGDVHLERGDLEGARPLYERCLETARKTLGPEHPRTMLPLWRLARLAYERGDHLEAVRLDEEALRIGVKAFGPDNPEIADALVNLGTAQLNARQLAAARRNLSRSIGLFEKSLGPTHPKTAAAVATLADADRLAGDYAAAIRGFRRAAQDFARNEESGGPSLSRALVGLALSFHAVGRDTAAFDAALDAESSSRAHLVATMRALSEREALIYESYRASGLELALDIASRAGARRSPFGARSLDALIRSRAVVLDELAARHRAGWGRGDSAVIRLGAEFATAQGRLSRALVQGPPAGDRSRYREMLDSLRRGSEAAEAALAARNADFRVQSRRDHAGLGDVSAALPEGSALVSYAEYKREVRPAKTGVPKLPPQRRLLAFVLRRGDSLPTVVPLGGAGEVEALVRTWQREVSRPPSVRGGRRPDRAYLGAGTALRRAVWDPVAARLVGAQRVFIVPDAALNLVSFYSLPARGGGFLVESGPTLHYLSSERDLLIDETLDHGGRLLAIGGPDFDAPLQGEPSDAQGREPVASATASGAAYRGAEPSCADFRSVRFPPLPGSLREVRTVDSIWTAAGRGPAMVLTGPEATETLLKTQAPECAALHLASHGFFVNGRCVDLVGSARGIGGTGPAEAPSPDEPSYLAGENPLLLSGLALAGSNNRGRAGPGQDDGILTAEEIAALDLSRASWVVLSACETGVGEVRAGEGVFGLRRAFQAAGAHTLILSLWDVDDDSAESWMRALYEARLARKRDTAEAAREAALAVLHGLRDRGADPHPFHWAAFVAAGDWR